MSKHTVDGGDAYLHAANGRFLFVQRFEWKEGRSQRLGLHKHPFCQLEMLIDGQMDVLTADDEFPMEPGGGMILVPPETDHGFDYRISGGSVISAKFDIIDTILPEQVCAVGCTGVTRGLVDMFKLLVPDTHERRGSVGPVLEGLLVATVNQILAENRVLSDERGSLVERAMEHVRRRGGKPVTISELAGELGISRSHLSNRFRKEACVPLKTYIDRCRGEVAAGLVKFSDLSIGEIAYQLGFPDPYTFSHFCRRTLGESPRHIRGRFDIRR